MALAREVMDKLKVALSVFAQGENSPNWSLEFAATVEAAKVQLKQYRSATQGR